MEVSVFDKLLELGAETEAEAFQKDKDVIDGQIEVVEQLMEEFDCPPTGYQLSISTYLALKTKQIDVSKGRKIKPEKNLLLKMPAAGGKTRVVIGALLHLATT